MTELKNFDIAKNIIGDNTSHRGGTIKVDVSEIFPDVDVPTMGAYQNYLGGGIAGAICGAAMFMPDSLANDKEREIFFALKEKIKQYYLFNARGEKFDINADTNTKEYQANQAMPVSAY